MVSCSFLDCFKQCIKTPEHAAKDGPPISSDKPPIFIGIPNLIFVSSILFAISILPLNSDVPPVKTIFLLVRSE